jgi:signal transduction histidine kinase
VLFSDSTDVFGICEENPNPVLRISTDGEILYANRGSRALCQKWQTDLDDVVSDNFLNQIHQTVALGRPRVYEEVVCGGRLLLQIIPVAGRDYVNVFGYALAVSDNDAGNRHCWGNSPAIRNEARTKRQVAFIRAAVHELRNPLTPIVTASEMLVNRLQDGVTARLARQINAGAVELNARIGELYEIARAEMGALYLERQEVDLEDLMIALAASLRSCLDARGVLLYIETDDVLTHLYADRGRLLEGLVCLVDSAIRRCPAKAVVRIIVTGDAKSITFKIKVTCIKLPDEVKNYLSLPCHGGAMDKAHFSSIGLKLTLSKILIELHDGHIQAVDGNDDTTFFDKGEAVVFRQIDGAFPH